MFSVPGSQIKSSWKFTRLIYHHTCMYHQLFKDCGSCIEGTHWLNALCDDSDGNAHSHDASNGVGNGNTEVSVDDDNDDDDNDALVMTVMSEDSQLHVGCSALRCWRLWVQQKFMVSSCAKKMNKQKFKVKH